MLKGAPPGLSVWNGHYILFLFQAADAIVELNNNEMVEELPADGSLGDTCTLIEKLSTKIRYLEAENEKVK